MPKYEFLEDDRKRMMEADNANQFNDPSWWDEQMDEDGNVFMDGFAHHASIMLSNFPSNYWSMKGFCVKAVWATGSTDKEAYEEVIDTVDSSIREQVRQLAKELEETEDDPYDWLEEHGFD